MAEAREILACPMGENDADAETVGVYLLRLLSKLWNEAESFDSKRPFGNSGWDSEIALALVTQGLIPGKVHNGSLDVDYLEVEKVVAAAIPFFLNALDGTPLP